MDVGKRKVYEKLRVLDIPVGALAIAARSPQAEKQWRHSLGWSVGSQPGQSSVKAEHGAAEVSNLP